jgi:hypothetical protein
MLLLVCVTAIPMQPVCVALASDAGTAHPACHRCCHPGLMPMPGSGAMQMPGTERHEAQCPMTADSHEPAAEVLPRWTTAIGSPTGLHDLSSPRVIPRSYRIAAALSLAAASPPRLLALRI